MKDDKGTIHIPALLMIYGIPLLTFIGIFYYFGFRSDEKEDV